MNNRLLKLTLALAIYTATLTPTLALSYEKSSATIAVWKTKSGKLNAYGPVQCLTLNADPESEVFENVNGSYDTFQEIGKNGIWKIYQNFEPVKLFHNTAQWVLAKARC